MKRRMIHHDMDSYWWLKFKEIWCLKELRILAVSHGSARCMDNDHCLCLHHVRMLHLYFHVGLHQCSIPQYGCLSMKHAAHMHILRNSTELILQRTRASLHTFKHKACEAENKFMTRRNKKFYSNCTSLTQIWFHDYVISIVIQFDNRNFIYISMKMELNYRIYGISIKKNI